MKRLRLSHVSGTVSVEIPNETGVSTITSPDFADTRIPTIVEPWGLPIIVGNPDDPDLPEIMWIVEHTSGEETATVIREAEYARSSYNHDTGAGPARLHEVGTKWVHGPTTEDFIPEYISYTHSDSADVLPLAAVTTVAVAADVELLDPDARTPIINIFFVQPYVGATFDYVDSGGITIIWAGGSPPTFTTTNGGIDHIRLTNIEGSGLYWVGEMVGAGLELAP